MIKLAQIGFLIGAGIAVIAFAYNYPIVALALFMLGVLWLAHVSNGRSI